MRPRLSRDLVLVLVLFAALVVMTAFAAYQRARTEQARESYIPYSTHSARPIGALALKLWLDAVGYKTAQVESQSFRIPDEARVLFVFAFADAIIERDALYILDWVERGNTLIVADTGFLRPNALFRALDIRQDRLDAGTVDARLTQPLVDAPVNTVNVNTTVGLALERNDYIAYIDEEAKPLLARFSYGEGTVWVTSAPALLTNENLADQDNAAMVLGMLGTLPRGSVIAFDEYHLGYRAEGDASLQTLVYTSPWGWGVLYAFVVVFAYLALNGQRFGHVLPLPQSIARRSPSEYVVSMANLFRRANKRGMVLKHYRHSLKRRLGRPFHLSPDTPDARFVEMMARLRPEINIDQLKRLLLDLNRQDLAEAELVKVVEQATTFGKKVAT